jgi:hypothetical protein
MRRETEKKTSSVIASGGGSCERGGGNQGKRAAKPGLGEREGRERRVGCRGERTGERREKRWY